jgi:hypothetical protein
LNIYSFLANDVEVLISVEGVEFTLVFGDAQTKNTWQEKLRIAQDALNVKRSSLHKTTGSVKTERRSTHKSSSKLRPKEKSTTLGSSQETVVSNPLFRMNATPTKKRSTTTSLAKTPTEAVLAADMKRSPSMDCLPPDKETSKSPDWSLQSVDDSGDSAPSITISESESSDLSQGDSEHSRARKRALNRSPSVDCLQKITANHRMFFFSYCDMKLIINIFLVFLRTHQETNSQDALILGLLLKALYSHFCTLRNSKFSC